MEEASPPPARGDGPAVADRPAAVEAERVTKRYGETLALDGAHITIAPGETHALVGRNGAGKSTLVSILTGLQAPDDGEVRFAGAPAPRPADRDAWRERVACVYQKSTIIPELTVAENLYLNRHDLNRLRLIGWKSLWRKAAELLETWSVEVDVRRPAGELGVEQRQFVEIARALSFGARFVILDEPTAQLDGAAIARLFERMRAMRERGVTFLFISHHLQEIYEVCDTVTVYRDARHILTAPVAGLPQGDLVAAMTGEAAGLRDQAARAPVPERAPVVLDVRGLGDGEVYRDVDLRVRAGEVVGLAGLGGSGKVELAETIVGLRAPRSGTIEVAGRRPRPGSVPDSLAAGVGFVPRDRHHQGLVPLMSIADNATMTVPERLGPAGFVSGRRKDVLAREMIRNLAIKTPGPDLPVTGLSGGNQQKVVMARALAGEPRLLVLITPTAGVDVRSKEFLLGKVEESAGNGTSVVIASDELDDLRLCDRVLVMFHGRVVAELPAGWHDHEMVAAMEGVDLDA
ncbi:sugar ABC transporter ATP-binding protein [Sphaerimonospora sp. CA-214678]|uniref:sugar ABC transporter ATP-binding protein n=1 Tax=Sphaerimonospora sp. CA-214678 TaxID=3240029 RepID=UPI003D8AA955